MNIRFFRRVTVAVFVIAQIISIINVDLAMAEQRMRITEVRVMHVDTHSASIYWGTSVPTTGKVSYGRTRQDLSTSFELMQTKSHYTFLSNLREGEDYIFDVNATDTMGRKDGANNQGFRTLGIAHPRVIRSYSVNVFHKGGDIVWHSNIPVKGTFECGYDTSYSYKSEEKNFGKAHSVSVKQFHPRQKISYRIRGVDIRGRIMDEYLGTFKTTEHNIAIGAKVTGTFTENPEPGWIKDTPSIISRVTDGSTNYFTGMATSGDPDMNNQWVEIDLGKLEPVGTIVPVWRQINYPKKYTIKGSIDGVRWTNFGDTFDAITGRGVVGETKDLLYVQELNIDNHIFRYIRIEIPKNAPYYKKHKSFNFVCLYELKIWQPEFFIGAK